MAQDLVTSRLDPYAAFGTEGAYLSFSKGEYQYGPEKEELPRGTRLVANMPGLRNGWRCWRGGKVVEDRTVLVSSGEQIEPRSALGDKDDSLWELDNKGNPRDPWVLSNILELANPDTGEAYVFSTNSGGGRRAIRKLSKEYSQAYRMRPGMLPILELDREGYMHKNPEFGKIYNPVFTIVGWTDGDAPSVSDDDAGQRAANPTVGQRKLVGFAADESQERMKTISRSDQPRF